MRDTEYTLYHSLIMERAYRLKAYDDAYPDEGMSAGLQSFVNQAIRELRSEGKLPEDYHVNSEN